MSTNLPSVFAFFQVYSLSDGLATEGHDCCVTTTELLPLISVRYFMFMLATQYPDRHQDVLVITVILAWNMQRLQTNQSSRGGDDVLPMLRITLFWLLSTENFPTGGSSSCGCNCSLTVSCNMDRSTCGWWPAATPDVQPCFGAYLVMCCNVEHGAATGRTLRDLGSRWRLTVPSVGDKLSAIKGLKHENINKRKSLSGRQRKMCTARLWCGPQKTKSSLKDQVNSVLLCNSHGGIQYCVCHFLQPVVCSITAKMVSWLAFPWRVNCVSTRSEVSSTLKDSNLDVLWYLKLLTGSTAS